MNFPLDRPMQVAVVDDTQLNLTLIGKLVDRTPNARAHNFERPQLRAPYPGARVVPGQGTTA